VAAAVVIALTRDKVAHRLPLFLHSVTWIRCARISVRPTSRRFANISGEPDDSTHSHGDRGPLAFGFSSKRRALSCVPPIGGRTPFQIDWWPPPATGTTRDDGRTRCSLPNVIQRKNAQIHYVYITCIKAGQSACAAPRCARRYTAGSFRSSDARPATSHHSSCTRHGAHCARLA
jgi:hypothetical protein